MDNFNAFIAEILTIDYSYFWKDMNVIISSDGTLIQSEYEFLDIDLATCTFKPFTETEIGAHYEKKFFFEGGSPDPSIKLTQSAITDLLNLTKEQQRAQVDRLDLLNYFWRYDDTIGITEKGTMLNGLSGLNPYSKMVALSFFKDVVDYEGVFSKNVPYDIDKIFLSGGFYSTFECYVYPKVIAIQRLVKATGIETGFWPRPSFKSDLPANESDNASQINDSLENEELDRSNTQESKVTVDAVAVACVYLEKVGFFKGGTLKSQITTHILPKFPYSYNSIYNRLCGFRDDNERLKAWNIIHINRAIKILSVFELAAPITIAKTDLKIIIEKIKANQP